MNDFAFEVGRVVVSKQGHDQGRSFLIVALLDERYALIADGDTRKLEHPKKKQLKHLRAQPQVATDVLPQIAKCAQTADSAIRKALAHCAVQSTPGSQRAKRRINKEEYAFVQE